VLALGAMAWALVYFGALPVSDFIAFRALGVTQDSRLGSAAAFFIYEVPHVLLLLVAIVFLIGIVNTYVTADRVRSLLEGRSEVVGTTLAALLGVVTPFCSCSAVPLFIGFVEAGVPLGVTFSFLVSAPMVNEVALVLLFGLFGWKVATLYLTTGLGIAIASGLTLGRLGMEQQIEAWVREQRCCQVASSDRALDLGERVWKGLESMPKVPGKTSPYAFVGIGVGAFIHGWVPEGLLAEFMGKSAWWSVPLAVVLGVPMYSGTATLIPSSRPCSPRGQRSAPCWPS
jgi:uncharacterized membrane protein YraQ (UPF0718 family)